MYLNIFLNKTYVLTLRLTKPFIDFVRLFLFGSVLNICLQTLCLTGGVIVPVNLAALFRGN